MAIIAKGKPSLSGRLVGYARVSTEEQGTDPQLDELRVARIRHQNSTPLVSPSAGIGTRASVS